MDTLFSVFANKKTLVCRRRVAEPALIAVADSRSNMLRAKLLLSTRHVHTRV